MFTLALNSLLQKRNISAKVLSAQTEIDTSTISRLLNGERTPTYAQIEKIADALKIDPGVLFPRAKYRLKDVECTCEKNKSVFPFEHGMIYQIADLDSSNVSIFGYMIYSEWKSDYVLPAKLVGKVKLILSVSKGSVSVQYPFGERVVRAGEMYYFRGYETSFVVAAGSHVIAITKGIKSMDAINVVSSMSLGEMASTM